MKLKSQANCFIVDNVEETKNYYVQKLGFQVDWIGDPPLFAILSRDGVTVMIRQLKEPNLKRPNNIPYTQAGWDAKGVFAWDSYIWLEDVDSLYQEYLNNGVNIIRNLELTDYGNRDFEIEDNNGYILCFGQV